MNNDGLRLHNVSKRFGDKQALTEVSIDVAPGEVLALTGPSGAGKTTLCNCITGLEAPDHGSIRLNGDDLISKAPGARRAAFLFESYALYPHRSVFENAASPLQVPNREPNLTAAELKDRVEQQLETLAIGHLAHRLPSELSGGQKQRAALARALVQHEAKITLLDEPISHLDAKLRHRLRGEIKRTLSERNAPALWVTPDGLEALSVGDRVAVLIDGRIVQTATPQELWENPAHTSVVRLIGDPPMNLVATEMEVDGGDTYARLGDGSRMALTDDCAKKLNVVRDQTSDDGRFVTLGVKPRDIAIAPASDTRSSTFEIISVEPFGKHNLVSLSVGGDTIRLKTKESVGAGIGSRVGIRPIGQASFFDTKTGNRIDTGWESNGVMHRRAAPAY